MFHQTHISPFLLLLCSELEISDQIDFELSWLRNGQCTTPAPTVRSSKTKSSFVSFNKSGGQYRSILIFVLTIWLNNLC
jgi:hypothetical protein